MTDNITLYAKWTVNTYTVTFDANGHGTSPEALTNVEYNTTISEPTPAPTETGWTFGGWYKEQACTTAWNFTSDTVTDNITLYAKWAANNTFTVTFKVVNGSWNDGEIADKVVTLSGVEGDELKLDESQIPAVGNNPNAGYEAGEWDITPDTETLITADTTYTYTYAEKAVVKYTVTVTDNGFGTASASPAEGTTGTKVSLKVDTVVSGYRIARYEVVSGGVHIAEDNSFEIGTEDVVINAVFEPIPDEKDLKLNVLIVNIQSNGSRGVPADVSKFTVPLRFLLSGNGLVSISDPTAVTFYGGLTNITLKDVRFSRELPNLGTPPYRVDMLGLPNYVSGSGIMPLLPGGNSGYRLTSSGWIQSNGTIIIYIIWEGGSEGSEEEEIVVRALPEDAVGAYKLLPDGTKEYLLFHTYDICMIYLGSDELCRGPERCFHKEHPYVNPFVQP